MANAKLRFDLIANTSGFSAKIKTAGAQATALGRKMSGIGRSMAASFTLPLALAGGAAIKMAMDFDRSMTKIKTLVGRTDAEVSKMSFAVKQMARDFAISSKEGADALYFITSAGLDTDNAIRTLNSSMKAAALGLGETQTIASLTTAAMAAYGKENLSTAAATDILMASVKEGRLDSAQLADSMEMVIDSANTMGVEFHELGAAFAAVSRTNKNASTAATGLRMVLMSVLKPSEQAKGTLKDLGLQADQVRAHIKDKGLLDTLTMLTERFKGNDEAVTKVFGSVRALQPVLSLTGANAEAVRAIFERMKNTSGSVDEAFKKLEQSADFRLRKSLNNVKEDMTSLGADLLGVLGPAISKVAGFISALSARFQGLSPQMQKVVIVITALLAGIPLLILAIGKIITIGGILMTTMATLRTAFFAVRAAVMGLNVQLGVLLSPAVLVAAAVAGIAYTIYKNWPAVLEIAAKVYNRFVDIYNGSKFLRVAIAGISSVFKAVFTMVRARIQQFVIAFQTMANVIGEFKAKGFAGNFKSILSEGAKQGTQVMTDAAEEIATEFSDSYTKALSNKLEYKTADQLQTSIDNGVSAVKGKGQEIYNSIMDGVSGFFGFGEAEGDDGAFDLNSVLAGGGSFIQHNNDPSGSGSGSGGGGGGSGSGSGGGSGDGGTSEINNVTTALERMGMTSEIARDQVMNSMGQLSNSIVDSMGIAGTALGNYVNQMLNMVQEHLISNMTIFMSDEEKAAHKESMAAREVAAETMVTTTKAAGTATTISSNIAKTASDTTASATSLSAAGAEATGDAIVSAGKTAKSFGPAAAFVLPALIAAAVTLITKSMKKAKKFKEGGIVSGTTLGMVGEYAGARSNPEVIAPLDKLKNMLPQPQTAPMAMSGNFVVDGQDLVLALGRANQNGERL